MGHLVSVVSVERGPLEILGMTNWSSDAIHVRRSVEGVQSIHALKVGERLPCVANILAGAEQEITHLHGVVIVDNSGASILPIRSALVLRLVGPGEGDDCEQAGLVRRLMPTSEVDASVYSDAAAGGVRDAVRQVVTVPALSPADVSRISGKACVIVCREELRNSAFLFRELRDHNVSVLEVVCFSRPESAAEWLVGVLGRRPHLYALVDAGGIINRLNRYDFVRTTGLYGLQGECLGP
jgi:hypothetical protein